MFPISDDNPVRRPPVVTWALIAACVAAFLWQLSLGPAGEWAIFALGVIPASLFGYGQLPPELAVVPPWATVFTSMFLHGGWLHLGGNMLYLWIFGNNVEDSMTRPRYLLFYLLSGVAAALAQSLASPQSEVPMVGASGAIAGVLGSYLIMHPRANVRVAIVFVVFVRIINMPAMLVLGVWFLLQIVSGAAVPVPAQNEPSIDELLERHLVIGTPETVIRQIKRIQQVVGITHFNCSFWIGDLSQQRVLKSMELFSKEVMPAFA